MSNSQCVYTCDNKTIKSGKYLTHLSFSSDSFPQNSFDQKNRSKWNSNDSAFTSPLWLSIIDSIVALYYYHRFNYHYHCHYLYIFFMYLLLYYCSSVVIYNWRQLALFLFWWISAQCQTRKWSWLSLITFVLLLL